MSMTTAIGRPLSLLAAVAFGALVTLGAQHVAARWTVPADEPPRPDALAVVDGEPITVDDFTRAFHRRGGAASFPRAEQRRALLDDLIREAVLVANARRAGYERDPDVRRVVRRVLAGRWSDQHIEADSEAVTVSDDEVRAFYESHAERFTIAEAAHAALIFVEIAPGASEERQRERTALAAELHAAAAEQDPSGHFGALAIRSSDRASRHRGGDIGWMRRGRSDSRFEPEVVEAIFALPEPGALAPLLSTERGVYVIRLLERKPASREPLEKVSQSIRQVLLEQKRSARIEALYAAAAAAVPIEIDERRLATLDLPDGEPFEGLPPPPAVPQS
jgi:hypothetical protein